LDSHREISHRRIRNHPSFVFYVFRILKRGSTKSSSLSRKDLCISCVCTSESDSIVCMAWSSWTMSGGISSKSTNMKKPWDASHLKRRFRRLIYSLRKHPQAYLEEAHTKAKSWYAKYQIEIESEGGNLIVFLCYDIVI